MTQKKLNMTHRETTTLTNITEIVTLNRIDLIPTFSFTLKASTNSCFVFKK